MDFLLIVRDRWVWGLVVALPVSLLFAYKQLNVYETYSAESTFRLKLPKKILNLTPVERDDFRNRFSVVMEHLNSLEFKEIVINSFSPEEKEALLREYKKQSVNGGPVRRYPS